MQVQLVNINKLKNNIGQIKGLPRNPRFIKDDKFKKLVQSIKDDPEMLSLREVIAYDNNNELVIIAGNMRLKACKELGIKEIPTKILPNETPLQKLKAYTIKDNVPFGEHDWEDLANNWEADKLSEWGLDVPIFQPSEEPDFLDEAKTVPTIKVTFKEAEELQQAENDIKELLYRKYPNAMCSINV